MNNFIRFFLTSKGLVSRVGFPAAYNGLNLLRFAECCLLGSLTLIELPRVLTSEQAEADSRIAEILRLEERMPAAEGIWKRFVQHVGESTS